MPPHQRRWGECLYRPGGTGTRWRGQRTRDRGDGPPSIGVVLRQEPHAEVIHKNERALAPIRRCASCVNRMHRAGGGTTDRPGDGSGDGERGPRGRAATDLTRRRRHVLLRPPCRARSNRGPSTSLANARKRHIVDRKGTNATIASSSSRMTSQPPKRTANHDRRTKKSRSASVAQAQKNARDLRH